MNQIEILENIDKQLRILNLDQKYYTMEIMNVDTPSLLYAGQTREIIDQDEEGFLVAVSAAFSDPNAKVRVYVDDFSAVSSPADLLRFGLIAYNPRTFWLAKYDDDDKVYDVWFTPSPYMHYYNNIRVYISAPEDRNISYSYSAYRYVRR